MSSEPSAPRGPRQEGLSAYRGAKVAITGGAGLIGSHVARRLCELGANVLVIDSLIAEFGGNPQNIADLNGLITLNISDIRDVYSLRHLLKGQDFLINLAGQTSHVDSMMAPFEDLEINCRAQLAILEVCRSVCPNVRVVFASTRQIYGRPEYLPVDEAHPLNPVDVNGINKIAGEWYHLLYSRVHDLETVVLRLTNVFGPGMRIRDARQIFLGIWVRNLLEGRSFELWGGDQKRDFAYVSDAAEAILLAGLADNLIGQAVNVGGLAPISLRELAERLIVCNKGQGRYDLREFPAERKKIDIGDYYSDDRRFRDATGWAPVVDLEEGLKRTLDYYRTHANHYL